MTIHRHAEISPCGLYRYRLDRWWSPPSNDPHKGRVGFLMLNPSTADAYEDDATIRKCMGFAQRWGFSGITVVNLYAVRGKDPKWLLSHQRLRLMDVVGERTFELLHAVGRDVEEVICAWGCESVTRRMANFPAHADLCVRLICAAQGHKPMQLGPATKTRSPRHPLMAPYSSPRIPFEVPNA